MPPRPLQPSRLLMRAAHARRSLTRAALLTALLTALSLGLLTGLSLGLPAPLRALSLIAQCEASPSKLKKAVKKAKSSSKSSSKKSSKKSSNKKSSSSSSSSSHTPHHRRGVTGSGRTGVKRLYRRDQAGQSRAQHEAGSRARWRATGEAARGVARERRGGRWGATGGGSRYRGASGFGRRSYRAGRHRAAHRYTSPTTSYSAPQAASATEHGAAGQSVAEQSAAGQGAAPALGASGGAVGLTGGEPIEEGGWLEGVELEASVTSWILKVAQPRSEKDDWTAVSSRVEYNISPTVFYRARLTLLTSYADLAVQYELRTGLDIGAGSLLDLALGAPALTPALAPLTLRYQRLRFEEGEASLSQGGGLVESQSFRTELDEVEARWQTVDGDSAALWVTGRYQSRAAPRQIYLTERLDGGTDDEGNAQTYSAYYDISDQLLWVPMSTFELGVLGALRYADALELTLGLGVGGGGYELRTPLEGALLDEGSLLSLSFNLGVALCFPLGEHLALKVAYDLRGQVAAPIGLPSGLEEELASDPEVNTADLSLSFGAVDLLSRLWVSLALSL